MHACQGEGELAAPRGGDPSLRQAPRGDDVSTIIVVERALLKAEVFRSLSSTAKTVYFDFLMKCRVKTMKRRQEKEKVILNNGELEYSYSEAEARGIPRSTFRNALDELIRKGFLEVAHSGSGGVKGDKSLYSISYRWIKYGTPDFEHAERPKDARQGRGFKKGNLEWRKGKSAIIGVKSDTQAVSKVTLHSGKRSS